MVSHPTVLINHFAADYQPIGRLRSAQALSPGWRDQRREQDVGGTRLAEWIALQFESVVHRRKQTSRGDTACVHSLFVQRK